ncbi:MAG: hypothetical protein IPI39_26040 [Candidatus Obscuribacter sp.]|nr:hypothetical protein [Candidatus Obscuribacter sp.]
MYRLADRDCDTAAPFEAHSTIRAASGFFMTLAIADVDRHDADLFFALEPLICADGDVSWALLKGR